MHITPEQIKASYDFASQVYDGIQKPDEAAERLHVEYGLNINSARDAIRQYGCLMKGDVFKRTLSAPSLEYCLTQIEQQRGQAAVHLALESARKHADYYEMLGKTKLNKFRSVIETWQNKLSITISQSELDNQFNSLVAKSLRDSASARNQRLQAANKVPVRVTTTSKAFVRNPDVVAEVLLRAKGICELCNKPAPFIRKSDGQPFLEVHHVKWLSQGGDDAVENAIALCPNCHRQQHLG